MEKIEIYWGADKDFEEATKNLKNTFFLSDVMDHISKTYVKVEGATEKCPSS